MARIKIHFSKYEAAGNDFIIIDNRFGELNISGDDIALLCNRRLGIGGDGLIMAESSEGVDFSMKYYNSDGNEATFCGNGGRAITAFAESVWLKKNKFTFIASDGIHLSEILSKSHNQYIIKLQMADTDVSDKLLINTGSPHHIVEVEKIDSVNVAQTGKKLRHDPLFGEGGCNVNFMEIRESGIAVRTYERGVEAETLSCGTGATASAIYYSDRFGDGRHTVEVSTNGGLLRVDFLKKGTKYSDIFLIGPAKEVFIGTIII